MNGQMESTYIADSDPVAPLSLEEERDLAHRFQAGDQAAGERLVRAHLRFVFKVAHSFGGYRLRFDDLVQEGNVGLLEAVKRFDPARGHRLISYAVHWIRAQMQAHVVRQHSLVRVGTSQVQRKLFYRLRRETASLRKDNAAQGRTDVEPTDSELAERLGVSPRSVTLMKSRLTGRDVSLDLPTFEDSSTALVSTLPSDAANPEEQYAAEELAFAVRERIPRLMEKELDERERYILDLRLFQERPWTLEQVGKTLGITRERTRQLEARAKAKLRTRLTDLAA